MTLSRESEACPSAVDQTVLDGTWGVSNEAPLETRDAARFRPSRARFASANCTDAGSLRMLADTPFGHGPKVCKATNCV